VLADRFLTPVLIRGIRVDLRLIFRLALPNIACQDNLRSNIYQFRPAYS